MNQTAKQRRSARTAICLAATTFLLTGNAFAVEAREIKGAADRAGNWLIEQFDLKEKVFGKGPEAKDVNTVAMVVTALCNHPRDYKEASGPFISEPVKYILSQINEDGTVKGTTTQAGRACEWVVLAFRATRNEKYAPLMEKCLAACAKTVPQPEPKHGDATNLEMAELRKEIECLRSCRAMMSDHGIKSHSGLVGMSDTAADLLKAQQKNGSFDDDVRKSAMALEILDLAFKDLK